MTLLNGVDVALFQYKRIDYSDRTGLDFVIAKCTQEHTIVDKSYATHLADALDAGVPVGAYHFIGAIGVPAHIEAEWFLEHADKAQFAALDVESNSITGANPLGTLGPNALADWVAEWNSIVTAARRDWPPTVLDYMNRGYATQLVPRIPGEWELWLATATGTPNGIPVWAGKQVRIEQWGSTTDVPGLGGLNVDRNTADGDWFASYLSKQQPQPEPTPEEDMSAAQVVLAIEALYKMAGNSDLHGQLIWCKDTLGKPAGQWDGSVAFIAAALAG